MRHYPLVAAVAVLSMLGFFSICDKADAADRVSAVRARGEVRICIWPDYFAISYRNPRTGELEGIDIDMAHEFARSLGVRPVFVDSSFAKLIENMTNDSCDVAMHAVGIRPDRAQHMNFAQPHLVSGTIGVTTKENKAIRNWADIDAKGIVVVVMKGTVMEPVMRETLKQAQLTVVDDFKAREQEVLSGRADIFMTDFPYGRRMVSLTDWARLVEPAQPLAPTPYAYAVPKGDEAWLKAVDQFVATVKADGRLKDSAKRHGLLPIIAP